MNFSNSWKEVSVRPSRWLARTLSKKEGLVNLFQIPPHPLCLSLAGKGLPKGGKLEVSFLQERGIALNPPSFDFDGVLIPWGTLFPLTAWKVKDKYCINK